MPIYPFESLVAPDNIGKCGFAILCVFDWFDRVPGAPLRIACVTLNITKKPFLRCPGKGKMGCGEGGENARAREIGKESRLVYS
jgi:hypothetical protein